MLTEKVKKDMQDAMRSKDELRLLVLRGALSEFTNALVAAKKKPTDELSDTEALAVFKRLAKQRKESAEQFTKGNRPELAEKEMKELAIIEGYLPEQASKEQIEEVAKIKIAELGAADRTKMGQLMGAIMKEFGGNADGTVVKEVVEELLP